MSGQMHLCAFIMATGHHVVSWGQEFYADVNSRMAKCGLDSNESKIMPGVYTIVGETEQEAEDNYHALRALVDEKQARAMLGVCLGGADFSSYPLDGPVPAGLSTNAEQPISRPCRRLRKTDN